MDKQRKRIRKTNYELTEKVMDLVYNNTNEFIEEVWHLIILAENRATTLEHLLCYNSYTQKKDINKYYSEIIEEESIELEEEFLKFIEKYKNIADKSASCSL